MRGTFLQPGSFHMVKSPLNQFPSHPWSTSDACVSGLLALECSLEHYEIIFPCNLGICAISKLCYVFSESRNCVPISRLCSQSWDAFVYTTLRLYKHDPQTFGAQPCRWQLVISDVQLAGWETVHRCPPAPKVSEVVYRSAAGGFNSLA